MLLLLALSAGQYPYTPAPAAINALPNYYNRTTQPLSPYLNLLRGGNPGVNYYYGVRPGQQAPGGLPGYGSSPTSGQGFLPQAGTTLDTAGPSLEPGGREVVMRSAGHPVAFGNTFQGHGSFFSVYGQNVSRGAGRPTTVGTGSTPAKPTGTRGRNP